MTINIDGIGPARYSQTEYVAGPVSNIYLNAVNMFNNILTKSSADSGDYDAIIAQLRGLSNLAKNGIPDPNVPTAKYFMSKEMANFVDLISRSLRSAGITLESVISNPTDKINRVLQWQGMRGFGVKELIDQALQASTDPHSLQAMIELDYVKAGHEFISQKLIELEKALSATQGVIDNLNVIEGLANLITITTPGRFKMPPDNMGDIPKGARELIAAINGTLGNAFSQDGGLNAPSTAVKFASAIKSFASANASGRNFEIIYRYMASAQFTQLFPTAVPQGDSSTALIAAYNVLQNQMNFLSAQFKIGRNSANTLTNFLLKVATDISTYFASASVRTPTFNIDIRRWILDNQEKRLSEPDANKAGNIQNNIVQAIRGAESLNDSKKAEVRQFMFFFDQFYKSSADVLSKVSQVIERMAQQISR